MGKIVLGLIISLFISNGAKAESQRYWTPQLTLLILSSCVADTDGAAVLLPLIGGPVLAAVEAPVAAVGAAIASVGIGIWQAMTLKSKVPGYHHCPPSEPNFEHLKGTYGMKSRAIGDLSGIPPMVPKEFEDVLKEKSEFFNVKGKSFDELDKEREAKEKQEKADLVELRKWKAKVRKINQMVEQCKKGNQPKGIEWVHEEHTAKRDPEDRIPHAHFDDGTSLNADGSIHDEKGGIPKPTRKQLDWLESFGWKVSKWRPK